MEPMITVSGLRGEIGVALTPVVAIRYAAAYSASCEADGPFVIASDGRGSAAMLSAAVRAGLHAVGRSTVDAGVCATPTVGVLVRSLGAAGGIQISASHNPANYNGMKLFSAAGRVIPAGPGAAVLARYRAMRDETEPTRWATHDRLGVDIAPPADPDAAHLAAVLATLDVEAIRRRRYRVLLDANHGAGGRLGRKLLETLGCDVTVLGETPDGRFAHTPEPTAENLASVLAAVAGNGAALGFCQDPDADRLAVIDENGRYIGEEYTVALCARHVLTTPTAAHETGGAGRRGAVVTNCSTSRMTERIAAAAGVPFFRSAVGEANVVDRMLETDAVFGGEGNGGPIDPRVGLVRDSFVGMGLILGAMAARDLPVSRLADEIPPLAIVKTKMPIPSSGDANGGAANENNGGTGAAGGRGTGIAAVFDRLEKAFPEATADRLDGLRLDWPGGDWLLLRASNTEPIVRAIAESATEPAAAELCARVHQLIADTEGTGR